MENTHEKTQEPKQKNAELINIYYFDQRGRRVNLGNNIENAKKEFKKYLKRVKNSVTLYTEYVTDKTYHIVTTMCGFYNYQNDTVLYINREDI